MTADLVTWLRAQFDAEERRAEKAAALCGCHPPAPTWLFDDEGPGQIVIAGNPHPDVRHKLNRRWNQSYNDMYAAEHITRWDPARVLREVAALRNLLLFADRLAFTAMHRYDEHDGDTERAADEIAAANTIYMTIAAIFSDRPGYDPDWATEETG